MDPLTISAGMSALGSMATPGGPSSASSSSSFDSSGWNVNFGSGGITSQRTQADPASVAATARADAYLPYVLAGAALLVVWRMTRKR